MWDPCTEAIHNVEIEDETKYGVLAYAINTMKSVLNDEVFTVHVENREWKLSWGEASQVLVLLSNYYADKKMFDDKQRWLC